MITFRLADSLPEKVLHSMKPPRGPSSRSYHRRIERYLDTGVGTCALQDSRIAKLVENALVHFHGVRYYLLAWVIMPNHVHVVIETIHGHALSEVVQSWKSFTAKMANQILRRRGRFWQRDYFDRAIRDERHLRAAVEYIHFNPCKAGLADAPEHWPYSSARAYYSLAGETPAPPERSA